LTTDWSHRHLVFAPPKTWKQAIKLSDNDRYLRQWLRRNEQHKRLKHQHPTTGTGTPLKGDWSAYIGNGASVGDGLYPAKYSFDVRSADCVNDYVAYNTDLNSPNPVAAFDQLTVSGEPAVNSTITVTNGGNTLTLTASDTAGVAGTNTSPGVGAFQRDPSTTTQATNIANAINLAGNGDFVNVTAAVNGAVVTVTFGTAGPAGNALTVTASSVTTVWTFSAFKNGATAVASIVGFNNLYTGCGGAVPSYRFAYVTGGTVFLSVTLSGDGSQLAYVQVTSNIASLVLLKWAPGSDISNPTQLSAVSNAAYRTCTAPCMTTFSLGANDSLSSPFYDFSHDVLYVGDDAELLHKFTGVFLGTPAEAGTPWPVNPVPAILANPNFKLTAPVYDSVTGKIFVADADYVDFTGGGYLHAVDATTGAATTSHRLANFPGILDTPIVDSGNGRVYVFYAQPNSGGCGSSPNLDTVNQFSTGFANDDTGAPVLLGTRCAATVLYSGVFDNAYYSGNAGHMYVCGNTGALPTLFQIPVNAAGVLDTTPVTVGQVLGTVAATVCSSVTEFFNQDAGKDYIFTSVRGNSNTASPVNCPSNSIGCVVSFDVTAGGVMDTTTPTAATATALGGTSGIIVDNSIVGGPIGSGTSQVYFSPLSGTGVCTTTGVQGFGGCAIQASQSGLN
jgi:hypothetical protein